MNLPSRLQSIDVFRSITMFLMIFVNEASGVREIPKWLGHVDGKADGMGFADIIFPVFLFIVGLSIPLAIKSRIKKQDSVLNISHYIITRSLALIIMGFFYVNLDSYGYNQSSLISKGAWLFGITLCFFLIWLDYSKVVSKVIKNTLIFLGVIILIGLAYIFQISNPAGMKASWWGILGIIGWAYLFSALAYLFTKGRLWQLILVFFIAMGINILEHININLNIPLITDGSSISIVVAGIVISGLYSNLVKREKNKTLWLSFFVLGVIAIIVAFIIRPYTDGISKIRSTPSWVLLSIGLSILLFEFFIYLIDVKRKAQVFKFIEPAGKRALTCYLIPYFLYSLMTIFDIYYPNFLQVGVLGLLRCVLISFAIIYFVGILDKKRIVLKV
jgi:heparan-alpha-glucosaminide N-acetyltransferase